MHPPAFNDILENKSNIPNAHAAEEGVELVTEHRKHKRRYTIGRKKLPAWQYYALIAAFALIALFSAYQLLSEGVRSSQTKKEEREIQETIAKSLNLETETAQTPEPTAFVSAAFLLLKNGGKLFLIYPAQSLCDAMCSLRAHRLEPKRLRFVCPAPDLPPIRVLIEARKLGGVGLTVEPPLFVS